MTSEHFIEEPNLSVAWLRAVRAASARGHKEIGPLIVSITKFDESGMFDENLAIRSELNALLDREKMQGVETVASTIFPRALWNPEAPRSRLFARYLKIAPRIRAASSKNRRGIYFERMISGGPKGKENQLEFALGTYESRKGVRRSILQVGVFNPSQDHSGSALLGFPCLQQVSFAPLSDGLSLNAFYASQYMVERAYGNYIGLCRLAQFISHELGMQIARVTCFTGIAECELSKAKLGALLALADELAPLE